MFYWAPEWRIKGIGQLVCPPLPLFEVRQHSPDLSFSQGNGWAAAGMLRVLATIRNSQFNSSMTAEQTDLINWINEIHTAMYKNLVKSPASSTTIQQQTYMGLTRTLTTYSEITQTKSYPPPTFTTQHPQRSWLAPSTASPSSQASTRISPKQKTRARFYHNLCPAL